MAFPSMAFQYSFPYLNGMRSSIRFLFSLEGVFQLLVLIQMVFSSLLGILGFILGFTFECLPVPCFLYPVSFSFLIFSPTYLIVALRWFLRKVCGK